MATIQWATFPDVHLDPQLEQGESKEVGILCSWQPATDLITSPLRHKIWGNPIPWFITIKH